MGPPKLPSKATCDGGAIMIWPIVLQTLTGIMQVRTVVASGWLCCQVQVVASSYVVGDGSYCSSLIFFLFQQQNSLGIGRRLPFSRKLLETEINRLQTALSSFMTATQGNDFIRPPLEEPGINFLQKGESSRLR